MEDASYIIRPLAGAGIPGLDLEGSAGAWLLMRNERAPQGYFFASVYFVQRRRSAADGGSVELAAERSGWLTAEAVGWTSQDVQRACLFPNKLEAGKELLRLLLEDESPRGPVQ